MSNRISPQGYHYGKEPLSEHPFWEETPGPSTDGYVKDIEVEVVSGTDETTYNVNVSYGNDTEATVGSIVVPEQADLPDNVVVGVDFSSEIVGESSDNSQFETHQLTVEMADGSEQSFPEVSVPLNVVSDVELVESTPSGDAFPSMGIIEKKANNGQDEIGRIHFYQETDSNDNVQVNAGITNGDDEEYISFEAVPPENVVSDVVYDSSTPPATGYWMNTQFDVEKADGSTGIPIVVKEVVPTATLHEIDISKTTVAGQGDTYTFTQTDLMGNVDTLPVQIEVPEVQTEAKAFNDCLFRWTAPSGPRNGVYAYALNHLVNINTIYNIKTGLTGTITSLNGLRLLVGNGTNTPSTSVIDSTFLIYDSNNPYVDYNFACPVILTVYCNKMIITWSDSSTTTLSNCVLGYLPGKITIAQSYIYLSDWAVGTSKTAYIIFDTNVFLSYGEVLLGKILPDRTSYYLSGTWMRLR